MMKSFASPTIHQQHSISATRPSTGPTKADLQVVRQIDHYMGQFGKMEQDMFRKEMKAEFGNDWYHSATDDAAPKLTPPPPTAPGTTTKKKGKISFGSRGRRLRSDNKVKSRASFHKRGRSPFPRVISIPTDATLTIPTGSNDCRLTTLDYERKNVFYLQATPRRATLMLSGKMMEVHDGKTHHPKRRTITLSTIRTVSTAKYFGDDEDTVVPGQKMGSFIKNDNDDCASMVESDLSESDSDDDDYDKTVADAPVVAPMPKVAANKTAPTTTGGIGRVAAWFFPKKALSPPPATMPELYTGPNQRVRQVKRTRRFRYSSLQDPAKNQV